MTEPVLPGDGAAAMRAEMAAASRLFLASNRNIPIRMITGGVITVAALPFLPWWIAAGWWCCLGLVAVTEGRIAAAVNRGVMMQVWEGMLVPSVALSTVTGTLYTGLMAALWMTGDPIARAFAIAQTCISVLYVLLQYYAGRRSSCAPPRPTSSARAWRWARWRRTPCSAGRPWTVVTAVLALGLLLQPLRDGAPPARRLARRAAHGPRRGAGARRRRRGRQRGQERLPRHHEPRDPHAAERRARHGPGDGGRRAVRRAARAAGRDPPVRRGAAGDPQRRARPLQDRGRHASSWRRWSSTSAS